MNSKFVFSTEAKDVYFNREIPFIPRINEWVNVAELLKEEELAGIKRAAKCWSGSHGVVQSIEYRHDKNGSYAEVFIWCED